MVETKVNIKGKQVRVGDNFHREIAKIQGSRLINGKSDDKVSMAKITNMIVKHNSWKKISEDIINAEEEEVNSHGK